MACCDPEYREMVYEKEKVVNEKGKERIPVLTKLLLSAFTVLGIVLTIIL
jgi:hypothetical protein